MGVLGELFIDGVFQCYTIEQPWRDNRRFVSCIPDGEYFLIPYHSPKYGEVVAFTNADDVVAYQHEANEGDRYACLVHGANWSSQLQGCVALGQNISWGTHSGLRANIMVTNSKGTLKKMLPKLINQKIKITWSHEK